MNSAKVSSLYIYPIKSCRGIAVDSVAVLNTGLANDRRWKWMNLNSPRDTSHTVMTYPQMLAQ